MRNTERIQRVDHDSGVCSLVFQPEESDIPLLNEKTLEDLKTILEETWSNPPEAIIIRSDNNQVFCGGADVEELAEIDSADAARDFSRHGQQILSMLSDIRCPTIAAVKGTCLGGGTELALACDAIFASNHHETKMGLPEVQLGIIPGFGGTQRLPRKISLIDALKMITSGKKLRPEKAHSKGLVDELIRPEGFHNQVRDKVLQKLEDGEDFAQSPFSMTDWLLKNIQFAQNFVYSQTEKTIKKKGGTHYPAPFKAVESVRKGMQTSLEEGLKIESDIVADLALSTKTRNMMNIFLGSNQRKSDAKSGVEDTPDQWHCGVIGAGVMGGGIAQLISFNGHKCRLKDIESEPLQQGLQQAKKLFEKGAKKGKWNEQFVKKGMDRISPTLEWSGFEKSDLVIEAVPEIMDLKQNVMKDIEDNTSSETLIATNTSSFPLTDLSEKMDNPERLVGIHFFNPVHKMRLVEVVKSDKTGEKWVNKAKAFVSEMGKVPIEVRETPGFLVNRLLFFYLQEAMLLLQKGVSPETIDDAMESFGMPMGPFTTMDEVGLDIGKHVYECLLDAFEDRVVELSILDDMTEKDWLGKKSGTGFYHYEDGSQQGQNQKLLSRFQDGNTSGPNLTEEDIQDRLVLALINEAARTLQEEVVESPEDLDLSMILGTGFAPFTGGPITYASDRGWEDVHNTLQELADAHGDRFTPVEYIEKLAEGDEEEPITDDSDSDTSESEDESRKEEQQPDSDASDESEERSETNVQSTGEEIKKK